MNILKDKLVELPKSRKEWKPRDAPEFVRHVMGKISKPFVHLGCRQ